MTRRPKPKPTKYAIIDDIDADLYDDYDGQSAASAEVEMREDLLFQAKVFKTEDGYKVALTQGDNRPSEYDDGPTAATRAGADALKTAMLEVLNSDTENTARLKAFKSQRKAEKARWVEDSRKQLQADQVELNGATDLKLEVGDTIILKCYDVAKFWQRSASKWTVMQLTENGLTGWSRFGYTSQADAIMYSRDDAPGRMVVVKDGKMQQVRAGKPIKAAV